MIWQRDHMVRRIYMTEQHSESVKPSWFGESIGHYENGDTLVIDTVGLSTKNSFIDNYRTPHSEKEHVVERYKVSADGNTLEAMVMVEDPDAFNEPLHMDAVGARRPIRGSKRYAPKTTEITSTRTCSRSRKPRRRISDRRVWHVWRRIMSGWKRLSLRRPAHEDGRDSIV